MHHVKDSAVATEQMPVRTCIDPEEEKKLKEELADHAITLAKSKEELSKVKAGFREQDKPTIERMNEVMKLICQGYREEKKLCYLIPDLDTGEMQYTLETGEVVFRRRLRPEERQMNIFRMAGNGQPTP